MKNEDILEALGVSDATDQVKETILEQVNGVVDIRFANLMEEVLSDQQKEKLSSLEQVSDDKTIEDWLKSEIPQFDDIRSGILKDYIEERKARDV